jgi:predicted Zn-dependent protease
MADPDKIVADIDRKQNEEDLANLNKYVKEPAKAAFKKLKDNLMGTDEQNQAAKERMRKMDEKNPDSAQAKVNKALGMKSGGKVKDPTMTYQTYSKTGKPAGMKTVTVKKASGGSVSSASKRADGCAIKGKTRA